MIKSIAAELAKLAREEEARHEHYHDHDEHEHHHDHGEHEHDHEHHHDHSEHEHDHEHHHPARMARACPRRQSRFQGDLPSKPEREETGHALVN